MVKQWTYSEGAPLNISKEDAEKFLIRLYPETEPEELIHKLHNGGIEIKMGALIEMLRKKIKNEAI